MGDVEDLLAGVEAQSWFRIEADGAISGFDGCNEYRLTPLRGVIETTAAACPAGVEPIVVRGPHQFVPEGVLTIASDGRQVVGVYGCFNDRGFVRPCDPAGAGMVAPDELKARLVGSWTVVAVDGEPPAVTSTLTIGDIWSGSYGCASFAADSTTWSVEGRSVRATSNGRWRNAGCTAEPPDVQLNGFRVLEMFDPVDGPIELTVYSLDSRAIKYVKVG